MRCEFRFIGERTARCRRCGFVGRNITATDPQYIFRRCPILGAGDVLAFALDRVGITKPRWARLKVYLRLAKQADCQPCIDRQEKWNRIGDGVAQLCRRAARWVRPLAPYSRWRGSHNGQRSRTEHAD